MQKTSSPLAFESLPLRERKAARVRHSLITASMARMSESSFDAVRIADLCRVAEITEQTFFNYFPHKRLLLSHIILLWGIETEYHARRFEEGRSAVATIEEVFALMAAKIESNPRVAAELLAQQASRRGPPQFPTITVADRLLWYPELSGVEEIEAVGILGILRPRVRRAIEKGELAPHVEAETVVRALFSIFVGAPLLLAWDDPAAVGQAFREQLALLWKGLSA